MNTITVFQIDRAGHFVGETEADESPMEPGVFLIPAGCITAPLPAEWPASKWPRWNGSSWDFVTKPAAASANDIDPVLKLQAFLAANPDVAAIINN